LIISQTAAKHITGPKQCQSFTGGMQSAFKNGKTKCGCLQNHRRLAGFVCAAPVSWVLSFSVIVVIQGPFPE
jgi:hypothetical protein